jgi:hypothetical protein
MSLLRKIYSILFLGLLSQLTYAIADKDADGMSDVWELAHGFSTSGNANASQAPSADPDGDGATNLQESIAATDPVSSLEPLGVLKAKITRNPSISGSFNLQWNQFLGKRYTVSKSTNLASTSWLQEGFPIDSFGTSPLFTTQSQSGLNQAFWKVAVTDTDPDNDGLSSWEEGVIGTSSSSSDSDSDAISDSYEYQWGGLTGLAATGNLDSDSLNNLAEFQAGTNPTSADSDNDQTNDDTEIEQDTSPVNASDSGQVNGGKIKLRIGTGTFLGDTYPVPAYPVYPINIFKRNLETGVETLMSLVPTTEFFNVQNVDLPADGSVYSLQVALPTLGSGTFDQPFRDFKWLCQCLVRTGSAPVVIIDKFDITTNQFGTAGRLLGTPTQLYNPGFSNYRVLIIPVGVNYLSRNTQTGITKRSNAIVEGSDVRPEVNITNIATAINATGQLSLTVSGTARDPMSEVLATGSGAVQSLAVYLDGDLVDTLTSLPSQAGVAPVRIPWLRRDSTVVFTKTLLIDNVGLGMHNVRLFTNPNALGKKGFDGATVLVEKVNKGPIPIASPPSFSFTLPPAFTAGVDSITITSGAATAVLNEEPSAPNSGLFTGSLMLSGAARTIGVQIPLGTSLSATVQDKIAPEVNWQIGAENLKVSGIWRETTLNSVVFNQVLNSVSSQVNSPTNLVVTNVQNDPNVTSRELSPTALRLEVPANFDFFGPTGLLTADLNGTAATFFEQPSMMPYGPPVGKKWFYYGTAAEARIFTFNDLLNGTAQSPSAIASVGTLDLTVKFRSTSTTAFKDTSVLHKFADLKDLKISPPVPLNRTDSASPVNSLNLAALPTYTMAEVRTWYAFLFDDAGRDILERYEAGGTGSDAGLAISLQTFWPGDSATYSLKYLSPYYQTNTGSNPQIPQLFLNLKQLATPVDAASALFAALQEIRSTSALSLRSSLDIDYFEILDTYLSSQNYDPNIEQALRIGRLGPVKDVLTSAKSAFEFGFSFIPGGDFVIGANDIDEAIQNGNIKGAVVTVVLLFTPEFIDRTFKYCKRKGVNTVIRLGSATDLVITPTSLKELLDSGVFSSINKSRAQKMVAIKDMLERGVINREHVEMLYDTGYLYVKADSSRAILGQNLIGAGFPRTPPGAQAHHWLPLAQNGYQLEKKFISSGVDPNLAIHGEFMDAEKHRIIHGKGATGWTGGDVLVYQWDKFFTEFSSPSPTQIYDFKNRLKALCAGDITNADLIIWPYNK